MLMEITDIDCRLIRDFLPERKSTSNKGDFGQSVIIGGSSFYVGAPEFAAESASVVGGVLECGSSSERIAGAADYAVRLGEAAMLSGSGTSVLAVPDFIADKLYGTVKYSSVYPLSCGTDGKTRGLKSVAFAAEEIDNLMKRGTAFDVGPGAAGGETDKIVAYILKNGRQNIVVDADALYLCRNLNFEGRAVLTPHIGEAARMCGLPRWSVLENQAEICRDYAKKHNAVVALKSAVTYISDGETVYLNAFGNEKLAKGGSGDVLSGVICGLLASGLQPLKAAASGCYILGRAAEISSVNAYSHLPTDIIKRIPDVFDELLGFEKT